MVGENLGNDRSLELDEIVRRFAEAESMLTQAHQQLAALLAAEQASDARAQALAETARAVTSYSERAERLLAEGERSMRLAGDVLEAGVRLLDGSELAKLEESISSLGGRLSEAVAEQSRATQDELAKINASIASLDEQLATVREEQSWLRTRRFLRV